MRARIARIYFIAVRVEIEKSWNIENRCIRLVHCTQIYVKRGKVKIVRSRVANMTRSASERIHARNLKNETRFAEERDISREYVIVRGLQKKMR